MLSVLIDPLSTMMANIAACIGLLIMIYSVNYMEKEKATPRFFFFMLLFIGGMVGLVMANNLLQMYFFWETVGLCSYSLIGFWYNRPEAAKAGMKAFIVTRIGDIFLLLGILLLYVNTGTFNFLEIRELIAAGACFSSNVSYIHFDVDWGYRQICPSSVACVASKRHGRTNTNQCPHSRCNNG